MTLGFCNTYFCHSPQYDCILLVCENLLSNKLIHFHVILLRKIDFCSKCTDQLSDSVHHQVDDLLADGVVSSGVVVGSILLASDQLLRVEQLAVSPRAHLI